MLKIDLLPSISINILLEMTDPNAEFLKSFDPLSLNLPPYKMLVLSIYLLFIILNFNNKF